MCTAKATTKIGTMSLTFQQTSIIPTGGTISFYGMEIQPHNNYSATIATTIAGTTSPAYSTHATTSSGYIWTLIRGPCQAIDYAADPIPAD
jgi:hypothetical protein